MLPLASQFGNKKSVETYERSYAKVQYQKTWISTGIEAEIDQRVRIEGLMDIAKRVRIRDRRIEERRIAAFVQAVEDASSSELKRPTRKEGKDGRVDSPKSSR